MPWERIFEWWPIYKKYENVEELQDLYNNMSLPENIDKMINANDDINKPRPPIVGLTDIIKETAGKLDIENDNSLRRLIGLMVGEILYDYGYRRDKQMNISHSGGCYFKSATRYKCNEEEATIKFRKEFAIESSLPGEIIKTKTENYIESTVVKRPQKEIATESNQSPKIAERYIKNKEYIETLKKFRKFWEKYGLSDKIKSIFLSLDVINENLSQGSSSTTDYSVAMIHEASIFPFVEQVSRYSSGMYLNIFQIAALLENKYPGIIELSGLHLISTGNSKLHVNETCFFTMLSEILLEEVQTGFSNFESALMSKNYFDSLTVSVIGLNHCRQTDRQDIPIFRLRNSLDIRQDSRLREHFGCFQNEISEEFFKIHNVMDNIVKILKKNTINENSEERIYYSLYQIIAELSQKIPIKNHYYPVSCIFFELMKRIFKGDVPEIKLAIWPGNTIVNSGYSYKSKDCFISIDGTANYTPLFSYQSSRSRKV